MPRLRIVGRRRDRELSGCAKSSGTPKKIRPQSERRDDGVDADRRGRDGQREQDGDERRRRADEQLERALPALPLDRAPGAEQRRRPDPISPAPRAR
jgi:hypothetical protein